MLKESSPEAANRVVAFTRTNNEAGGVTFAEPRIMARRGVSRAALYLAHIDSLSQEIPPAPVPEQPEESIWSSVLDFFVEGFANCGAPLYSPMIHLNAGSPQPQMEIPVREAFAASERRTALSLVTDAGRRTEENNRAAANDLPLPPAALPSQEIGPPSRWNWLTSCWEVAVAIRVHMRQEREIRQAIDALAALDDSILKDIGIHHRGQIEHAVRNGHDF